MKRTLALCLSLTLMAVLFAGMPATASMAPVDVVRLSPEETLARDLALHAEAEGITVVEAAAQHRSAEIIGAIAVQVSIERPDIFVGSALSENPGGAPTLYIKGPADKLVQDLVDASGIEIVLADNQPFSFNELEARKLRVHQALETLGFRDVVTRVNISGRGLIPAAVTVEAGLPTTTGSVLSALPADLRSSVQLTISDTPVATDTTSFGGMLVTKGGAAYATSGWSVRRSSDGVTGVTTAGHAVGANGIVHPGDGSHTFVFKAEHRGEWGDIEWHTTNVAEPDEFYASASIQADVVAVEPRANISEGEWVCQYGRFSNDRDCDLEVFDVSIACTLSGVFNNRLVQMNGITSIPGDSGGGWSVGSVAYGSQKGWCNSKDAWSVADLYDEALGVAVLTN